MGEDHTQAKRRLRGAFRALAHETSVASRAAASATACRRLGERGELAAAGHVALYVPLDGEPDPAHLAEIALRAGKGVYYPRVTAEGLEFVAADPRTFRAGPLGVPEPSAGPRLPPDGGLFFVVPGLAFDLGGTRLGRGGGHYDRALAARPGAARFGLAFEFQVLPRLPRAPWDVPMNGVATEARWVEGTKT